MLFSPVRCEIKSSRTRGICLRQYSSVSDPRHKLTRALQETSMGCQLQPSSQYVHTPPQPHSLGHSYSSLAYPEKSYNCPPQASTSYPTSRPGHPRAPHLEGPSVSSLEVLRRELLILLHLVLAFGAVLYTRWLNWAAAVPRVSSPRRGEYTGPVFC